MGWMGVDVSQVSVKCRPCSTSPSSSMVYSVWAFSASTVPTMLHRKTIRRPSERVMRLSEGTRLHRAPCVPLPAPNLNLKSRSRRQFSRRKIEAGGGPHFHNHTHSPSLSCNALASPTSFATTRSITNDFEDPENRARLASNFVRASANTLLPSALTPS